METWANKTKASVCFSYYTKCFLVPFGRPNYNSFIATFCYKITNGEEPTIIKDSDVNLIYINELSHVIHNEIVNPKKE